MAKKAKKLNTDLDDSLISGGAVGASDEDLIDDDGFTVAAGEPGDDVDAEAEDTFTYAMGDILVDDPSVVQENEDHQLLQTAAKAVKTDDDDEDEDAAAWVDDIEDIAGSDPVLDAADFDEDDLPADYE